MELWVKGSATVIFKLKFLTLSKGVDFQPCASAQGRDGKEDEGCGIGAKVSAAVLTSHAPTQTPKHSKTLTHKFWYTTRQ